MTPTQTIDIPQNLVSLAETIQKLQGINLPKAKKLKEELASRIVRIILNNQK